MTAGNPPVMSAELVLGWVQHALADLGEARARIDALNVFPVPDGDTGTNLYLTMSAAASAVVECFPGADHPQGDGPVTGGAAASALAMGALLGARGNSGVIMSQILRGASEVMGHEAEGVRDGVDPAPPVPDPPMDGSVVHRMLQRGADLAYAAVAHPVEGTILTVIREAAEGAGSAVDLDPDADARTVLVAALEAGQDALDRTPSLLESLRLAGVVDAGGQGLIVVLSALRSALEGAPAPDLPSSADLIAVEAADQPHTVPVDYIGPAYEVMYLLDADPHDIDDLRSTLDALGDSLVVVGSDRLWNVHVHVDDAGAAVEAALSVGRPSRIRITHLLADRAAPPHHVTTASGATHRRLVAVSHAPGVAQLLHDSDVVTVPARPQVRPSTAELLAGIEAASAVEVILLPSDKDTTGVAEIAAAQAREAGMRVSVIPTRSIVQTLAAVAVHDPEARFDDDVVAMTRAAGATRYGAVTVARRDALTTAGPCRAGEVLGLVDGDIVLVGTEVESVVRDMLEGMLAVGGELVTLLYGSDASADLRAGLEDWIEDAFPLVEATALDAGQPLWPVILGVE